MSVVPITMTPIIVVPIIIEPFPIRKPRKRVRFDPTVPEPTSTPRKIHCGKVFKTDEEIQEYLDKKCRNDHRKYDTQEKLNAHWERLKGVFSNKALSALEQDIAACAQMFNLKNPVLDDLIL